MQLSNGRLLRRRRSLDLVKPWMLQMASAVFALCAVVLAPRASIALGCGPRPRTPPPVCQTWICIVADGVWDTQPLAQGTACNDGDPCTSNDVCDGAGTCAGTFSCLPGTPGAISGPTSSSSGSYLLSWGTSSGVVDYYSLFENGVAF